MTNLHIALHDGFKDDVVAITINGKKVFEKSGVTTKLQISYADSFDTETEVSNLKLEVDLPQKNLSSQTNLQVDNPTYLGINLELNNTITYQISPEPFRYL